MVDKEFRTELLPIEERIRRLGGERSYAFGVALGGALMGIGARLRALVEAQKPAPSIGSGHPAGTAD